MLAAKSSKEADKIITLFTKDHGKLVVIAKGVKKISSRKRGNIELFSHIKTSIVNSHDFGLMTEAQLLESFENIRKSLKKTAVAYFMVEVVAKVAQQEEKNIEIFDLLLNYLGKVNSSGKLKEIRENFTKDILTVLGFWPRGRSMLEPDIILEQILERRPHTVRIAKKLFY